jgi:hypothetical protein
MPANRRPKRIPRLPPECSFAQSRYLEFGASLAHDGKTWILSRFSRCGFRYASDNLRAGRHEGHILALGSQLATLPLILIASAVIWSK